MQTIVQVVCKKGSKSLRDAIVKDKTLVDYSLKVSEQKRTTRPQGWTKIHSTDRNRHGAINIEWDADMKILLCRVVTKAGGRPNPIIGDFVDYLLGRYTKKIETIHIFPR